MRGSQPQTIRQLNLVTALDMVRRSGHISRAELARALSLSSPTVSELVAFLLRHDLVAEHGPGQSNGGRKPMLIEFRASMAHVLGIDIGSERIVAALADLEGKIVHEEIVRTPSRRTAVVEAVIAVGRDLAGHVNNPMMGAGVGVPGYCDRSSGTVIYASNLPGGWRDLALGPLLEEAWGWPVLLDNDGNLAARGEMHVGTATKFRNFVFFALGRGVGSGVVIDGNVYRGRREMAGEVGLWLAGDASHSLEDIIGGERWRAVAVDWVGRPDVAAFFDMCRDGHTGALAEVHRRLEPLCVALQNTITLLDPEALIFGGGLTASWDVIGPVIQHRLTELAGDHVPEVAVSTLPQRATLVGAIADALESFGQSQHLLAQANVL